MLGALLALNMLTVANPPAVGVQPPARSVAVFPLTALVGVGEPAAALLSESLVQQVRDAGAFSQVLSPREIASIMPPEQQKFLMLCASESCTVVDNELAGALGVSHIMAGTVGRLGDTYVLNLKLLEVDTALTLGSAQQVIQGTNEGALLKVMNVAVQDVLRSASMAPPQAVQVKQTPKDVDQGGSTGGVGTVGRWAAVGLATVSVGPLLLAAAIAAAAGSWTVAAFGWVDIRARVPSPAHDRTARFYWQLLSPAAALTVLGAMVLLTGVLGLTAGTAGVAVSVLRGGRT